MRHVLLKKYRAVPELTKDTVLVQASLIGNNSRSIITKISITDCLPVLHGINNLSCM